MQPQQIQQLPTQQPPSMIQTPILSSNSPTSPKPQPSTTIKKGRFRVVKGAALDTTASIDNHPAPVINDAQDALDTNSAHVVSAIKRGRFVVKKGTAPSASTTHSNSAAAKGTDYASDTSLTPTKQIASSTKQKGRFLVKTGGSTANLQAQDATTLSTIAGGAVTVPSTTSQQQNANNGMVSVDATDNGMGTAAYNVCPDQSDGYTSNEFASSEGVDSTSGLPAVATKKKGRFVVKTGGGANNAAMHPPPELNATIPAQEGIQNIATGNVHHVPLANPNQNPVPTVGVQTTTLGTVQVVMCTSNGPQPLIQALPQQPPQQSQVSQLQLQSQPQSEPSQPPVNANLQLPLAPRRAVTDDRATDYASSGHAENIPRSNRPIASSSSNGTRGKNGSMIGGSGGVGKLLHYLDTIRSEVVDADRCIASLQSDKRFLVSNTSEIA